MKQALKRFFAAVGAAVGYLGIYLGSQLAVSGGAGMIAGFLISFEVGFEAGLSGGSIDGAITSDKIAQIVAERLEAWLAGAVLPILIVSQLFALLLLCLPFLLRKKSVFRSASVRLPSRPVALLPALGLGIGAAALVQILFSVIPFPEKWLENYASSSSQLAGAPLPLLIVASVLLAPILEELLMRGLVYTRLRSVMPRILAMLIASAIFGALHGDLLWFFYTFLLGMLMNAFFERSDSLPVAILIHLGFNLCGTLLGEVLGETVEWGEAVLLAVIAFALTPICAGLLYRLTKPSPKPTSPEPISGEAPAA